MSFADELQWLKGDLLRQKRNAKRVVLAMLKNEGYIGTILAKEQKLEFDPHDELELMGITCCDDCGEVWRYDFDCPVCKEEFVEAIGLHEPRWIPFEDNDDNFECAKCGAKYTKTVPGAYRMDTTWRLICLDG